MVGSSSWSTEIRTVGVWSPFVESWLKLIVKKMVAEYEIIKTEKEKLEKENSKLKEEIAEMIRVNESIFESGSKLDIRPEDLPNRFSKLLPVPYRNFRFTIMQSYD